MYEGSIVLTNLGNSTGFYLTERIADKLKVKVGDIVDVTVIAIFKGGLPSETNLDFQNEKVIKSGKRGAIILDKKKLDSNGLEAKMTITVQIEVVKK